MAKRVYREFNLDPDAIPEELRELTLKAGSVYKISGLVFQGNGETSVVMFPTADNVETEFVDTGYILPEEAPFWNLFIEHFLTPSMKQLQAILDRTDDPLVFQEDETGVLKAIVRKSQRPISGAVQQQIWYRDGYQCLYCGKEIPDVSLTVDHFIPLEKDGEDDPGNYLSACRKCNKNKGNQDPEEYCKKNNLDYYGLMNYLAGKASKTFIMHLS